MNKILVVIGGGRPNGNGRQWREAKGQKSS